MREIKDLLDKYEEIVNNDKAVSKCAKTKEEKVHSLEDDKSLDN